MAHRIALIVGLSCIACGPHRTGDKPCEREALDGSCLGVTREVLCSERFCTAGAQCARTWYVDRAATVGGDGTERHPFVHLDDAAKQASSGECVALAAGSYQGGLIPSGVSLLGAGAEVVTITTPSPGGAALSSSGGRGPLLRGFAVTGDAVGLALKNLSGARVEQVRIESARRVGVDARGCTDLQLEHLQVSGVVGEAVPPFGGGEAEIFGIGVLLARGSSGRISGAIVENTATQGILASESPVEIVSSEIRRAGQYGVAIDCVTYSGGSALTDTRILESRGIGLLVIGGRFSGVRNEIGNTDYRSGYARAVQLQRVQVDLSDSRIFGSVGQGLVAHGATGTLARNQIVRNEERGVVLQEIGESGLRLEDNTIQRNARAGLTCIQAVNVTVTGGEVSHTVKRMVIQGNSSAVVGDGVQILDGSKVTVEGITLLDNHRFGVLVDDAQAELVDLVIGGGKKAVVVQNAGPGAVTLQNVTDLDGQPVSLSTSSLEIVGQGAGGELPRPPHP